MTRAIGKTASGKAIRPPNDALYAERAKAPKWNVQPTALDYPKHLRARLPTWTKEDHREAAALHTKRANRRYAQWQDAIREAEAAHGDYGSLISAGLREHWPGDVKDVVRTLCHATQDYRAAAWAHNEVARMRGVPHRVTRVPNVTREQAEAQDRALGLAPLQNRR